MSDIPIQISLWVAVLVLAYMNWQLVLAGAAALGMLACVLRGIPRIATALLAGVLVLDLVADFGVWQLHLRDERESAAAEAKLHSTLSQPATIDGLALPAQTDLRWMDEDHTKLMEADLPGPATVLGVQVDGPVSRDGDDGWTLVLAGSAGEVDGWPCQQYNVKVTLTGRLRSCRLSAAKSWNGWDLPPDSLVDFDGYDGTVQLATPGHSLPAPEIGHDIPDSGAFNVNRDGSLHSAYFEQEALFVVRGIPLWNAVTWDYDTASFGQGRKRKPRAVSGALVQTLAIDGQEYDASESIRIRLSDGAVTPQ